MFTVSVDHIYCTVVYGTRTGGHAKCLACKRDENREDRIGEVHSVAHIWIYDVQVEAVLAEVAEVGNPLANVLGRLQARRAILLRGPRRTRVQEYWARRLRATAHRVHHYTLRHMLKKLKPAPIRTQRTRLIEQCILAVIIPESEVVLLEVQRRGCRESN